MAESIVDEGPLLFEYKFKWRFMNEVSAVAGEWGRLTRCINRRRGAARAQATRAAHDTRLLAF